MNNRGFTLIEIMIALVIFATMAVITSSILYQTFHLREGMIAQSDILNTVQTGLLILQKDIEEYVPRPTRGNEMHLFRAFIGQPHYLEFTRGGAVNPMAIAQRSTLKRVAYLCKKHQLIRRLWTQLDTPDRHDYQEAVLLDNLSQCSFAYLNRMHQLVPTWYQDLSMISQFSPSQLPVPNAIQLSLTIQKFGTLSWFFILPGGTNGS